MPQWLVTLSWISVVLGLVTAGAVASDVARHPQHMKIMNVVWPVTALYLPVAGWWVYTSMGRPMAAHAPMMKEGRSFWKSVFVSATHCASGCVIGDLIGAPIVFAAGWVLFGERLYAEYAVEFVLAYVFGVAFQYLAIRETRQVPPREALVDAVKSDTLALTAFEVGLFGWMALNYFLVSPAERPDVSTGVYWFMMQIGMILGLLTSYPANWLLVKWGVKTGM